jgi:putative transposase
LRGGQRPGSEKSSAGLQTCPSMLKDNNKLFLPKRPRIKGFEYKGSHAYFVTICTSNNRNVFISKEQFDLAFCHLNESAAQHSFNIYAYCFMPDHLHILLVPNNESASLAQFIKIFKQKSAFYYKQKYGDKLWQPSYHDHVLRKAEDIKEISEYILNNPVRKGMVGDYRNYPYLGSMVFDI